MADRYVVTMKSGDTMIGYDGKARDPIAAILACVRVGGASDLCLPACDHAPAGIYDVEVGIYGREPSMGRVGVRADGSLTIGARWGLPTPTEPIDRADLGIDVGAPHE